MSRIDLMYDMALERKLEENDEINELIEKILSYDLDVILPFYSDYFKCQCDYNPEDDTIYVQNFDLFGDSVYGSAEFLTKFEDELTEIGHESIDNLRDILIALR